MPCVPIRPLLSAIFAAVIILSPPTSFAAEKRSKPASAAEVARLKRENDVLRAENRRLRKLLAESIADPQAPAPDKTSPTKAPAKTAEKRAPGTGGAKESGFWLSDNGKRHNAGCQYYQTSKGKPSAADQGIACKVCGG